MKTLKIALLAVLLTLGSAQISFNLNAASYEVVSGYWSLTVPVNGAVAPLIYSFQTLPGGWIQVGNTLRIPSAAALAGGTWAVKVSVTDALGISYRRSLLIKIDGGSVFLGDYPYEQTFTFTSSGAATVAPSTSTVLSTSSSSSTTITQSGATTLGTNPLAFGNPSSTTGVIALESSKPGISRPLPTAAQLDALINSGDIVAITQTIQSVIASTLTCTQKTGYLNDFLGRIESFIVIKERQIDHFEDIIDGANTQIESLRSQIATFEQSILDLGIPGLQGRLSALLVRLQQAYDAFNVANVDLTPYNLNISANLQTIQRLSVILRETEAQLSHDETSLGDVLALIITLEAQLNEARGNRDQLQTRILAQQAKITTTQSQIDIVNAENVALNNRIAAINSEKQTLQVNAHTLETQAQNLRNTISSYQAQQSQYNSQITLMKTQIRDYEKNLDDGAQRRVEQHLQSLNGTIPSLRQQIDYVRFNCNGVVNYTVSTLDGTIRYTFGRSSFSTFVTNQFGEQNSNAAAAHLGPVSNVTLTPITLLDTRWVELFGQPFSNDLQAIGNGASTQSFQFLSDFSCRTDGNPTSGSGIVVNIEQNVVRVRKTNSQEVDVLLGACTNVLLLNSVTPRAGANIYWRGVELTNTETQAFSVLLF